MFAWPTMLACRCCVSCCAPAPRYYFARRNWTTYGAGGTRLSESCNIVEIIRASETLLEPSDNLRVGGSCYVVADAYHGGGFRWGFPWAHRQLSGASLDDVEVFDQSVDPNGVYHIYPYITINCRVAYRRTGYAEGDTFVRRVEYLIYYHAGYWLLERFTGTVPFGASLYPGHLLVYPPAPDIERTPIEENVLYRVPAAGTDSAEQLPVGEAWEVVHGGPSAPGASETWDGATPPMAILTDESQLENPAGCGDAERHPISVSGIETTQPDCCEYRIEEVDGMHQNFPWQRHTLNGVNGGWVYAGVHCGEASSPMVANPNDPPSMTHYEFGPYFDENDNPDTPCENEPEHVVDQYPVMGWRIDGRHGRITQVAITAGILHSSASTHLFLWEGSADYGDELGNQVPEHISPQIMACATDEPCEETTPYYGENGVIRISDKAAVGGVIKWVTPCHLPGTPGILTSGGVSRPEQASRALEDGRRGEHFDEFEDGTDMPAFSQVVVAAVTGGGVVHAVWVDGDGSGAVYRTQHHSLIWTAGGGYSTVTISDAATGWPEIAVAGRHSAAVNWLQFDDGEGSGGGSLGSVVLPDATGVNQVYGNCAATSGGKVAHATYYDGNGPAVLWSTNLAVGYAYEITGAAIPEANQIYINVGTLNGKTQFRGLSAQDWYIRFDGTPGSVPTPGSGDGRWVITDGVSTYALNSTSDLPGEGAAFVNVQDAGDVATLNYPQQKANAVAIGPYIAVTTTISSGRTLWLLNGATGEVLDAADPGYIDALFDGNGLPAQTGLTAAAFAYEAGQPVLYVGGAYLDHNCNQQILWKYAIGSGSLALQWGTTAKGVYAGSRVTSMYAAGSAGSGIGSESLVVAVIPGSENKMYCFDGWSNAVVWKVYQY